MGSGSFDARAYRAYASTTTGKTTDAIYTSRSINKNLDPRSLQERCKEDAGSNAHKLVITHCDQQEPPCQADMYSHGPTRTELKAGHDADSA